MERNSILIVKGSCRRPESRLNGIIVKKTQAFLNNSKGVLPLSKKPLKFQNVKKCQYW